MLLGLAHLHDLLAVVELPGQLAGPGRALARLAGFPGIDRVTPRVVLPLVALDARVPARAVQTLSPARGQAS